jgi:hypothetical protein
VKKHEADVQAARIEILFFAGPCTEQIERAEEGVQKRGVIRIAKFSA